MASKYPIHRVVSSKGNKAQITVRFDKRVVTRHIINWEGRHPDDTLPKRHNHLASVVTELQSDVRKINQLLATSNKEIETNGPDAGLARKTVLQAIVLKTIADAALLEASDRYTAELTENPLIVSYYQDGEA